MTTAWFDCSSGASGDMLLGALLDAGASLATVQAAVDAVGPAGIRLEVSAVTRQGLAATKLDVLAPSETTVRSAGPGGTARTWSDVRTMLERADLAEPVRRRALDVFTRLARAEAEAHGVPPEEVHFHEVGAVDAIADVVGTCAALDSLGITTATSSAVALGSGVAHREHGGHGAIPVPGPAVLAVFAAAKAPVYAGPSAHEMCTPTGAALLAATVTAWGGLPLMTVTAIGVGAGTRDLAEAPNVVRVVIGAAVDGAGGVDAVVLSANVDDLDPRLWPSVLARLMEVGAADAWLTPILMKKGRPAHTLSVLTERRYADVVRRVMVSESSTIGVREHPVTKHPLDRQVHTVDVEGEPVRVKLALLDGVVVNAAPEFDDVAAAAARLGRPVKAVLAAATAAAATLPGVR